MRYGGRFVGVPVAVVHIYGGGATVGVIPGILLVSSGLR